MSGSDTPERATPHAASDSAASLRPSRDALLSVQAIDAGYGDTQVLWDISLEVARGEVVALVGANGAGKSTLLATISGLLRPLRGTIVFAGRHIERMLAERIVSLGMAHVPQGRRLFAALSVEDNLKLGAYPRRTRSRRAIHEHLDRVYALLPILRERRRQLAGSLSGGEQQMCAIGRGLMSNPDLLLIDEMSLGLAPMVVDSLLAAIDTIHREQGLSVLLVEQDVQIALERADRGYVIENGRMVVQGPATELLRSAEVRAAYLGE